MQMVIRLIKQFLYLYFLFLYLSIIPYLCRLTFQTRYEFHVQSWKRSQRKSHKSFNCRLNCFYFMGNISRVLKISCCYWVHEKINSNIIYRIIWSHQHSVDRFSPTVTTKRRMCTSYVFFKTPYCIVNTVFYFSK